MSLARGVLGERYTWLEEGILGPPEHAPAEAEPARMGMAAGS